MTLIDFPTSPPSETHFIEIFALCHICGKPIKYDPLTGYGEPYYLTRIDNEIWGRLCEDCHNDGYTPNRL